MAPQTEIPLAANVLSTIGTVFWCIQLVPQIWHNWRRKSTEGIPASMMMLWAVCAVPIGVYAIVQNFAIPLKIQPQIFGTLALINWTQILVYSNGWKLGKAAAVTAVLWAVFGGAEALLILTLRGPYERGVAWPMVLVGVIAAVLLAVGLIPPYFELWRRGGRVVGLNFVFLSIDWLGAIFSLMALVAQNTFDILGGVSYIVCILLEAGIFASQVVWLIRTRRLRKQAKEAGIPFDDMPEAKRYQYHKDGGAEKEEEP